MKLKLGTKINLLFLSIIIIFSMIIAVVLSKEITEGIKNFAIEKAKGDLNLAYEYIDVAFPGEWQIKDNQLYKGTEVMNNNTSLIKKIADASNDTVTIFQEDTRVATNVMLDGKLALGTTVSNQVAEKVINQKEMYYGEAFVGKDTYQAAYKPLLDQSGNVIGILYLGSSDAVINTIVKEVYIAFIVVLLFVLMIAIVLILIFTRRIRKRLNNIVTVLEEAGSGKFTSKLADETGDELTDVSNSFNRMTGNIKILMQQITNNSEEVKVDASTLLVNAQETELATENATNSIIGISENVEQQLQMIEQSASAINDITSGITHITNNTLTVADTSQTSMDKANHGQNSVKTVVNQMEVINQSNIKTNQAIVELANGSREIGKITDVITSISEQTNLLALNASIEAARAGDSGKGFAVVAGEVKKLALESRNSANMIAEIVQSIQNYTQDISQLMVHTDSEIQTGIEAVRETGATFNEIYETVESSNIQIQELSAISQQMSASMQEINASFEEVSSLAKTTSDDANIIAAVTEEQAALTVQVKESAEKLSAKAEELKQSIAGFKI